MYVILDQDQRVCVTYMSHAPTKAIEVPEPDGWDAEHQHDWQMEGGVLVYNPLPVQEPPTSPMEALQAEVADLTLALARLIGTGFEEERGPGEALPEQGQVAGTSTDNLFRLKAGNARPELEIRDARPFQSDAKYAVETSGSAAGRAATIEGGVT